MAKDVKHALPDPTPPAAGPEAPETQLAVVAAKRQLLDGDAGRRADKARGTAYRARFVLTYFALAIVAGSAVGSLIVVLDRPHAKKPPAWSKEFVPTGSLTRRLIQIADVVPKAYLRENGEQLVGATVTPPQLQLSPDGGQSFVTIPLARTQIQDRGEISTFNSSSSIQFVLCGDGTKCEIATGKPTSARYLLLEREALEISLYALRYVSDLDSVTVLFPPSTVIGPDGKPTDQQRQTALFMQRKDVLRELSRPITTSLASRAPRIGKMSKRDLETVQDLALPHTFDWSFAQAPDGAFVRMLQPASR